MTPEHFEKIALWMGWKKWAPFGMREVWTDTGGSIHGRIEDRTFLTDSESVEALNRLVEKGYTYTLEGDSKFHCITLSENSWNDTARAEGSTIPSVVQEAILLLIEGEG